MCAISQGFNESVVTSVATYILDSHASCTWLLSSANHHLTLCVDQVPNVFLYHYLKGIVVSNNNTLPISHVGSNFLNINDNYSLSVNNLLHTPCNVINILYIQNLCIDNNVFIEFHSMSRIVNPSR